jgi:30S ribosomal protein S31
MGRGDVKTKRGKISNKSFGKVRTSKTKKATAAKPAEKKA